MSIVNSRLVGLRQGGGKWEENEVVEGEHYEVVIIEWGKNKEVMVIVFSVINYGVVLLRVKSRKIDTQRSGDDSKC